MDKESTNYMYGDLSFDKPLDLWVLLSRTHYAVERVRELELLHSGISTAQAQVLNVIQNAGGETTLTQISKYTLRRHHSVSNLIIKMSEQGLVRKVKLAGSKEYKILITPKGKEQYNKNNISTIETIFTSLSDEDKEQLIKYLKELLVKARNLLGVDYKPPYLSQSLELQD